MLCGTSDIQGSESDWLLCYNITLVPATELDVISEVLVALRDMGSGGGGSLFQGGMGGELLRVPN